MSDTPLSVTKPSPVLGADTDEILRSFGYSDEEIARLKAHGITE
jgi:crotonobetainyl-CoA:carnitine CoA-transferase CaiB-like acyl-CoA transferase